MISLSRLRAELRLAALTAGLVAMSLWMSAFALGGEAVPATAQQMMKQAHDGRAVWSEFSGFTAKVRCRTDGVMAEGRIVVERNGDVKLSWPKADEQFAWVQRTLDSVIGHRVSA